MASVVFVGAHPDDETLAMGVAIAEHARGGDDIHVAWMTTGTGSVMRAVLNGEADPVDYWGGVPHDPAAEGYEPLTVEAFGEARLRESTNAVRLLVTGYPGRLTIHGALGSVDGSVTVEEAEAAIGDLCARIGGGVRLATHTYLEQVEEHPDHCAIGEAARRLREQAPQLVKDVRHFILPHRWVDLDPPPTEITWLEPGDQGVLARITNACRAFGAWSPTLGSYAIGYHSVEPLFQELLAKPRSAYHTSS
jgi:LmbE family N-acetylglucosaminyl deacetylase